MGYEIITENEGHGIIVRVSDAITAIDLITINNEIYEGCQNAKIHYQIWDFTKAVTELQISPEEVRFIAIQDGQASCQNPGMLIALVGNQHYFAGKEMLYATYTNVWAKDVKVAIFERMEEARGWVKNEYCRS